MGKINPTLVLWGTRMGYMSYGWDAGVLGGVLQTPSFQAAMKVIAQLTVSRRLLTRFQTPDVNTTSMIVAAFLLASWLGCVITASPWSDKLGRRFWMLLGGAIQIAGTVVCASAYSSGQMIGGRIIIVST